nr:hypothetical protein [Tanacetum cinerariifolium]
MVNTRIDAELAAAVRNALQALLPQIHAEIREEFCTAVGTVEEQEKNFQWSLRKSTFNHLMCIPFTDKDCKKNTAASTSGQANKKPGALGRVFAINEDHATKTSGFLATIHDTTSDVPSI